MKQLILHTVAQALDSLEVALCAFDEDDRALAWNATFLDFFPEHRDAVHVGEHYRANLRRFYESRLAADELPLIEQYIDDGVARHRAQRRPYEFDHRGFRVRVSSVEMGRLGRVRVWRKVAPLATTVERAAPTYRVFNADTTAVLEHIADGVLVADPGERVLWANQAFLHLYGLQTIEQARGVGFEALYRQVWAADAESPAFRRSLDTLRENRRFTGAPFELALPGQRWVRVVEQRGHSVDGRGYFVHVDITPLKRQALALREAEARARRSEERYRLLAAYSSDVTLAVVGGRVSYVSPSVTNSLGWRPEQIEGRPASEFCHPDDAAEVIRLIARASGAAEVDYRARARHADGHHVWVEARARRSPADAEAGTPAMLVINIRNIGARKAIEEELEITRQRLAALAVTDGLTGLANRRHFDEALDEETRRAQRDATPLSLLLIDIDDFKTLNDRHGHPVGDQVLRQVAAHVKRYAERAGDVAARYGGEEFALLLPHTGADQALRLAEQLRRAVRTILRPQPDRPVSVSIGVACADVPGLSAEALLARTDQALYAAKREGKDRALLAWENATGGAGLVSTTEQALASYH